MKKFLLLLLLASPLHAFQELADSAVDNAQEVGLINSNIRMLYAGKLDIKPKSIIPKQDSTYNLGASGTEWLNLHVDIITFGTEILPKTDSTGRIGKSGQEVATIHVDTITATTAAIGFWKYSGTEVHNGASSTSYTDLDLSAVVGANRAMVLLRVTGNLDNVACRENGDSTEYFSTSGFSSANRGHSVTGTGSQIWCPTDSAGVIEWRVQTTNTAVISVIGYIR